MRGIPESWIFGNVGKGRIAASLADLQSRILYAQVEYQKEYEMYLRDQFIAADKSKNGFLFLNEFATLLKQLNINMDEVEIEKVFEEANTDKGTMVRAECDISFPVSKLSHYF